MRNAEPIKLTAPGRGGDHKDDALSREWINLLVRPRVMLRQRDKDAMKTVGRNDHSSDRRDDDEKDDNEEEGVRFSKKKSKRTSVNYESIKRFVISRVPKDSKT